MTSESGAAEAAAGDDLQVFPPDKLPRTRKPQIAGVLLIVSMILFLFWSWNLYYSAEQTSDLSGSGVLEGMIYERLNDEDIPLRGVTVSVEDTNLSTTTDRGGYYRMDKVPAGIQNIRYERPGFKSIVLKVIIYSTGDLDRQGLESNNFTFPSTSRGGLQLYSFKRSIEEFSYPLENGTLMLRVQNGTGAVMPGVRLNYTSLDYDLPLSPGENIRTTDASGEIEVDTTPGKYLLNITAGGYTTVLQEVLVSPANHTDINVSLTPGTGEISLPLERTVRLNGVIKTEDGLPVKDVMVRIEGTNTSIRTDSTGAYTLDDVPVGLGTLTMTRAGYSAVSAEMFIETDRTFDQTIKDLGEKTYNNSDVTLTRLYQCSIIYLVVGLFLLVGGFYAFKRKSYGVALFSAILGVGATIQFLNWYHICAAAIMCMIAVVLVWVSRREFS